MNKINNVSKDALLVLIYFLLFLFFVWKVPFVVGALVLGFYFSIILSVPYDFVLKKTNKKFLAVISYILVVFIFVYTIISFFPKTFDQVYKLFQASKDLNINGNFPTWLVNAINELKSNISSILLSILNKVVGVLPSLITMLMFILVTMVGIESIKSYLAKNISILFVENPDYGKKFVYELFGDIRKYIRGQVLVSFISAFLTTLGLILLNIPSALTLGVLTFLGGFFPFVGLLISAVPMYLFAFSTGGLKSVIFLTFLLVGVNQAESWIYGPRIQSDNLKLHWFVIILAIFLLGDILGFVGVLIAIPVLLFVRKFWKYYVLKNN
ncbi:AI-2E family transporter [Fervidobacterium nodosum]|uniref:AI-2E family transporter n=1 Tax=Fervidobacterium nodosum (strain ATCC 35602 / DSM 5306 / Rt17-B1) TaxID=381764 RepID=A7HN42_FERNB|nr:AI-2E family transporter [Fervidobacterium nodosum]ABS61325.1 protein of unknown function UPF0118 [Fervidobacterium nodosum Rt17-B1]